MTSPPDDVLDLLTAYALGALEPEEITRVNDLLEQRPELRRTLAELRATAHQLPYALAEQEPPADLRQRVLDRAMGRERHTRSTAPARPPGLHRLVLLLGGVAAVAIVAAVLALVQLAGTRAELAQAQAELAAAQAREQQVAAVIAEAQVIAELAGDGGRGTLLSAPTGTALLVSNLPPPEPGRVYQLWLIEGENAPVSAGTFTVDQRGYGLLTLTTSQQPGPGDTLAVTSEPAPGSPAPTTPILIAGQPATT